MITSGGFFKEKRKADIGSHPAWEEDARSRLSIVPGSFRVWVGPHVPFSARRSLYVKTGCFEPARNALFGNGIDVADDLVGSRHEELIFGSANYSPVE